MRSPAYTTYDLLLQVAGPLFDMMVVFFRTDRLDGGIAYHTPSNYSISRIKKAVLEKARLFQTGSIPLSEFEAAVSSLRLQNADIVRISKHLQRANSGSASNNALITPSTIFRRLAAEVADNMLLDGDVLILSCFGVSRTAADEAHHAARAVFVHHVLTQPTLVDRALGRPMDEGVAPKPHVRTTADIPEKMKDVPAEEPLGVDLNAIDDVDNIDRDDNDNGIDDDLAEIESQPPKPVLLSRHERDERDGRDDRSERSERQCDGRDSRDPRNVRGRVSGKYGRDGGERSERSERKNYRDEDRYTEYSPARPSSRADPGRSGAGSERSRSDRVERVKYELRPERPIPRDRFDDDQDLDDELSVAYPRREGGAAHMTSSLRPPRSSQRYPWFKY